MEAIYEINLKIAPLQLNKSQYLSRIEGSPPKRNAAGSIPVMDASKQRCKPLFSRVYSFFCLAVLFRQNHFSFIGG